MKKILVNMMLASALLVGGTAYAQTQTDATTGATTNKENVNKGDKSQKKKGDKDHKGFRGEREQRYNPFEGVQLTDDQQQRLQVLQRGLGPVQLDKEQMEKIPENKNLTNEQKKQLKEERKARQLENKKKYLNGVKEILTPDQYVIFLENFYLYAPLDQGKGNMKHGKGAPQGNRAKMPQREKPANN